MGRDASTSVGSESSGSNTLIGLALVGKSISASCILLGLGAFHSFSFETFWALLLMMQCTTRLLKDRSARQHDLILFSKTRRDATHVFNVLSSSFTWIVSFSCSPSELASYCRCLVLRTAISFPRAYPSLRVLAQRHTYIIIIAMIIISSFWQVHIINYIHTASSHPGIFFIVYYAHLFTTTYIFKIPVHVTVILLRLLCLYIYHNALTTKVILRR